MISAGEALSSLVSSKCPACNAPKTSGLSFCQRCFAYLPRHMQKALYRQIGQGYERALDEAMRCIAQRRLTCRDVRAGRFTRGRRKR
jgi:hypothetical protein